MNLIIDIGNTRTKYSVFYKKTEIKAFTEKQITTSFVESVLKEFQSINKCILSASGHIPENTFGFLQNNIDFCMQFSRQTPLPFTSEYKTPETIGLDRLAAVAGANTLYPGKNVLIIDMGTAITYDFKNSNNVHLGGNISPGLEIRFKALNHYTENLPLIKPKGKASFIGLETNEAIENGVLNGILFELNGYIEQTNINYNNLTILLTGGDAHFFVNKLKKTIFVVQNLVNTGLNSILSHNAENT